MREQRALMKGGPGEARSANVRLRGILTTVLPLFVLACQPKPSSPPQVRVEASGPAASPTPITAAPQPSEEDPGSTPGASDGSADHASELGEYCCTGGCAHDDENARQVCQECRLLAADRRGHCEPANLVDCQTRATHYLGKLTCADP